MMKKNALAKKILCGLLAAGVLGACGSALADSYGINANEGSSQDQIVNVDVNTVYPSGKIENVDRGIYAGIANVYEANKDRQFNVSYTLDDIKILASNVSGGVTYGVQAGSNGNIVIGSDDSKSVVIQAGNFENNESKTANGLYAYANTKRKDALITVKGKTIEISANASNSATGVYASAAKGKITIGNLNSDSVLITATSKGIVAKGVENKFITSIEGKNITIKADNENGKSYGVVITNSIKEINAKTKIGTDETDSLSISATGKQNVYGISSAATTETDLRAKTIILNAGGEYVKGIETAGKTSVIANNAKLNLSGKNAYGVAASGNTLLKIKDNLTIDVDGKDGKGIAVQGSDDEVDITADQLTISAKGNTATTVNVLKNADIEIGKGASELNLSAQGTKEAYIVNAAASNVNARKPANVKLGENAAKINLISEATETAYGVSLDNGTNLTIGGETSEVSIKTTADKQAIGILAMQQSPQYKKDNKIEGGGSVVNVNGKSLVIDVTSAAGEAHGIHVQNNSTDATSDFATVNINTAKTVINARTGIAAYSQGVVNMNNGDVEINAEKAIETRGNAVTTINQDGTHTVKLNGDIVFDVTNDGNSGLSADATVNVNLSNAESSLTGSVKTAQSGADSDKINMDVNGMKLNISNDAAWNMTGDSFVNSANVSNGGSINVQEGVGNFNAGDLNLDNANLNLQGNDQKVTVKNLAGDKGTVTTSSLENKVTVEANNAQNLTVNGTNEVTDSIASGNGTLQGLADVVKGNENKSIADKVTSAANDIIGGYSADVDQNGKVVTQSVKTIENTTNRAISDMASISLMTWRQENNDMNKRLGELRDSKGEHGAWARMARGESKYGAQNVKNQYNYYQVGYDEKLSVNPNWTVGVALTRTEGTSTFAAGSGENKHTGVALYGSYLADNGSFLDLIAKYARMDNDYKTIGAGVGDADYETNGYSISAEYGKRFTKANGFWIEPQVELTYGKVGSASYTTSKGALVNQDGIDSLVGRLGFSLGKDIKQGNIYLRASYLYDFDGETTAYMSKAGAGLAKFEQDLGGGWWEVGVGTNINLSDATHLYFDVEKTYGGNVVTPWQWNAGVRWSF